MCRAKAMDDTLAFCDIWMIKEDTSLFLINVIWKEVHKNLIGWSTSMEFASKRHRNWQYMFKLIAFPHE